MSQRSSIYHKYLLPMAMGVLGALVVLTIAKPSESPMRFAEERTNVRPQAQLVSMKTDRIMAGVPGFRAIADRATQSVVKVRTLESVEVDELASIAEDDRRYLFSTGSGSGVVIRKDGYIVTNQHVISGASDIEVELADGRVFAAKLVGEDERTDLAVLKIEANRLPTLTYADSDEVAIGDWVLAIGNPFEYLTSTVTAGIVSALGRDINILTGSETIESFIQTDAVVNPGSSGGALLDAEGRLIGINTAIATPGYTYTGYSFAIPSNLMRNIVSDLIEYGHYRRALLGVQISELSAERAQDLGLDARVGVLVQEVNVDGAADKAGIIPGDVLVSVNGKELISVPQLQALIGGLSIGDIASVELIDQRGARQVYDVRLKSQ